MRLITPLITLIGSLMLSGCASKATNPADPYESFNRKVYRFNTVVDAVAITPITKVYKAVIPSFVRKGVNNVFNNLDMIPSVASDILQLDKTWFIKDSWRFILNTTIGVGGLFDVAEQFGLPAHYNDLGLTFAKWGVKQSPYLVIPIMGPSTVRDGSGLLIQFVLMSPYVYIDNDPLAYGLGALRYIDLRSQLLDAERLMDEALDKYSFMRDAYLQHRNYLINGTQDNGELYVQEGEEQKATNDPAPSDYVPE